MCVRSAVLEDRDRDEIILGIPLGPVGPMGLGIARLVYWEWEWEWLDGNGWE